MIGRATSVARIIRLFRTGFDGMTFGSASKADHASFFFSGSSLSSFESCFCGSKRLYLGWSRGCYILWLECNSCHFSRVEGIRNLGPVKKSLVVAHFFF